MEFAVDTNILLTFFWQDSFTKGILLDQDFEFFAPEYALEEINRNKKEVIRKTKISQGKFEELKTDLAICVEFIPLKEYAKFLEKAMVIPNKEDVDFIALALKFNLPLWSNDKGMKEQSLVKIYSTDELLRKINK